MELRAYAKINWDLLIRGKRPDGFHLLDTVMVNVDLHDSLNFEASDNIRLTCSDASLPTDSRNLVVRAAELLAKHSGFSGGACIHLTKRIPAGGGMGGGSSDAASTLLGLNKLWNLGWTVEQLQPLAAELGSDVAFFLYGGWRRCLGRGEIVEALEGSENWPPVRLLLILPPWHVSTPLVYKALHCPSQETVKNRVRTFAAITQRLEHLTKSTQNTCTGLDFGLANDLTVAAQVVEPRLIILQRFLESEFSGRWLMSGSGAVHFVISSNADDALTLETALREKAGPGIQVLTATTFTPLF